MRKTLATLLAVASSIAAFGSLAGVAAADVPNPHYFYGTGYSLPVSPTTGMGYLHMSGGCNTSPAVGNLYQYGAWGYYVDGCTSQRFTCPSWARNGCQISGTGNIRLTNPHGEQVTMNTRVRVFNTAGGVSRWYDRSCPGTDTCTNNITGVTIWPNESATTQCNGVHAYTGYGSYFSVVDTCSTDIKTNP
jgi:hypothetical protein